MAGLRLRAWTTLILVAMVMRLPAMVFPYPIDDEAVYGVVANEVVHGAVPYRDAIERKPPLLFWTYAEVFRVAGASNFTVLHVVATLWLLASMVGLLQLGRAIGAERAGLVAAITYAVFQGWGTWRNLAFNGEMMMNLPIIWSWALTLGRDRARVQPQFVLSGALAAAAALMKQPAAIAAVPLLAYIATPKRLESPLARRVTASKRHGVVNASVTTKPSRVAARANALLFTAGGVGVVILAAAVLWHQGILRDAVYWAILDHDVPHIFWARALLFTAAFGAACLPLVVGTIAAILRRDTPGVVLSDDGAASLRQRLPRPRLNGTRGSLVSWLVVSAVGAVASGRFYPHYYIQLLPPMAVLSGLAYTTLTDRSVPWRERTGWRTSRRTWHWAVALMGAVFVVVDGTGLWQQRGRSAAALYVQAHSNEKDRLFVWGQAPGLYLEADRRPASRYITTFPLTGYVFAGPLPGVDTRGRILAGSWDTLRQDFSRHPPAFIVDTQCGPGALYPAASFESLRDLLEHDYVGVARWPDAVVYRRTQSTTED